MATFPQILVAHGVIDEQEGKRLERLIAEGRRREVTSRVLGSIPAIDALRPSDREALAIELADTALENEGLGVPHQLLETLVGPTVVARFRSGVDTGRRLLALRRRLGKVRGLLRPEEEDEFLLLRELRRRLPTDATLAKRVVDKVEIAVSLALHEEGVVLYGFDAASREGTDDLLSLIDDHERASLVLDPTDPDRPSREAWRGRLLAWRDALDAESDQGGG